MISDIPIVTDDTPAFSSCWNHDASDRRASISGCLDIGYFAVRIVVGRTGEPAKMSTTLKSLIVRARAEHNCSPGATSDEIWPAARATDVDFAE